MSSQIFVVTVTYNNRFHLLKKVVEATLREGVDKVIVVDNNSAPESREKLKKYQKKNRKVDVIYLPDNLGSAGGFKKGLEKAYKDPECKFIWLLDVIKFWESSDSQNFITSIAKIMNTSIWSKYILW